MQRKTVTVILMPVFMSCSSHAPAPGKALPPADPLYTAVHTIPLPEGYTRPATVSSSFAAWLGNIPLKKDNTVYLYNGQPKRNQRAQFAVLDIPVGDKDLQQCADAVMRLRASYLFDKGAYDSIVFRDNNNTAYRFTPPYTVAHFDRYLQQVFGSCGTASLAKQLRSFKPGQTIVPGDVLIRGGFPGHAVIVVDMATNENGQYIYLLAQSYMPAQDIHILNNPADEDLSPWYVLNNEAVIITPEYSFTKREWKSW
jgi:hypothetical protein